MREQHDGIEAPLPTWRDVAGEPEERRWRAVFNPALERGEGPDLAAPCPICGQRTLHLYYLVQGPLPEWRAHLRDRFQGWGVKWEWCSTCGAFDYSRDLAVPNWWSVDWGLTEDEVEWDPGPVELARRRHAHQRHGTR